MVLEEEVGKLAPRLLRYCLGRLGDRGLAEEASQEALTALVDRWRRLGPPESAAAFVFAVARRRAGRLAWRRRLWLPLETSDNGHRCDKPRPDQDYDRRDKLSRTLAALDTLPRRERETLLLVAVGGLGTAEAARLQGISRSAVKMRVHRARRRLEHLLEDAHGR